jgi:hypothetical protein
MKSIVISDHGACGIGKGVYKPNGFVVDLA